MRPRPVPVLLAAVVLASSALHAQTPNRITTEVDTARMRALPNHLPRWANPLNDAGLVPPDRTMDQMIVVLARSPEQEQTLEKLLADQQDPASPDYHRWLTPSQVGERFGLSGQDIGSVRSWLESQGLHVGWVAPSGIFIGFSGTAANLNRAFQTELRYYKVNGEQRFSVSSDPKIPEALAPAIKAIRGLYTIEERPVSHIAPPLQPSPVATYGAGYNYITPADFATVYDLPKNLTGAGVTIGIVATNRTYFADFDNFRRLTGSTFPNPTEVVPTEFGGLDPGPALTAPPLINVTDQFEATLDVERAGSVAPGASLLLVVTSDVEIDAQYLVNTAPVVQVISISFTECESEAGASGVSYWDTLFQQAAAEGISVVVASGDSGASGCDAIGSAPPASPAPNSPNVNCSSSYVTCVGGTEFNDAGSPSLYWNSSNGPGLSSALGYIPEGAWNESSPTYVAASGGGVSAFIPTPSWQTGAGVPAARSGRYTPDVSFSASDHDAYYTCCAMHGSSCTNGSIGAGGGTSATAPDMAGITALLDQQLGAAQGNLNPALYQMAASAPAAFHDVTVATSGVTDCDVNVPSMCNNSIPSPTGMTGGQAGYLVGPGYDLVTGLGSLDVKQFIANYPSGSRPARMALSSTPLTFPDQPVGVPSAAQTVGISDTGTAPLNPPAISIAGPSASDFSQTNNCQPPSYAGGACSIQVTFNPSPVAPETLPWGNRIATLIIAAGNAGNSPATVELIGTAAGLQTPWVMVQFSAYSVTTAQPVTATVFVFGESGYPTPTGWVTLSGGSYVTGLAPLVANPIGRVSDMGPEAFAAFDIPAGSLPIGVDWPTATYVPDFASSPIYSPTSGQNSITVIAATPGTTAPTVTVTPASSSVTNTQDLWVTVSVGGGSGQPTPTGQVSLTSNSFGGNQFADASGSSTFIIPAGQLAIGPHTLTGGYTPDSASSSIYTPSTGTSTVVVTGPAAATPSVTVTPSASSIAPTQGLTVAVAVAGNPTPTGTATVVSGEFGSVPFALVNGATTIPIIAGMLPTGTNPLAVLYTPDSASALIYNSATGSSSVTVTNPLCGGANPPLISPNGVVNAASFASGSVAPGEIVAIFGCNLGPSTGVSNSGYDPVTGALPTTLGQVSVSFGGHPAPLFFVSNSQINVQVPYAVSVGGANASVVVTYQGVASAPVGVRAAPAAPGIFQYNGRTLILNALTGAVIDAAHPISRGNWVSIYGTGPGLAGPTLATGEPAPASPVNFASRVQAMLGGQEVPVGFAGMTPGFVGLLQINLQVPLDAPTGSDVPLDLTILGVYAQASLGGGPAPALTVAIQ
jgi:uncharacterized protein (TIGR03437 family)